MTSIMTNPIIILGAGYTGKHLSGALTGKSIPFFATSRDPSRHLSHVPADRRVRFDLEDPATWGNIPVGADLIWCFPATPVEQVQAFAHTLNAPARRMVVLGSTSAYEVSDRSSEYPPPWIDETAPLDLSKPRVRGEEFLRNECEAVVLHVAGIYGPGRNPVDWVRQGRVSPSRKYVNLIHVEDLAAICLLALDKGKPGEAYNVSDGQPRTWHEISATAQQRWGVTVAAARENPSPGKRISNAKLRTELGYTLKHPDLYEALASLEAVDRVTAQDGQNGFQQGPRRDGTGGVPSGVR
jgi:nucleoside-diphosphate-sugar epimerase